MFETRIDTTKNFYLLRLSGLMTDEEITRSSETALREMTAQMKMPFTLITDISEFRPLSQEGTKIIRNSVKLFAKLPIRHRIRIVGKSAVAAMQMQRETSSEGPPVHIVHSMDEAIALVDQLNAKRI